MLIGITVSTNYSHILEKIIDNNQRFFTKWYIVTAKTDTPTINMINRAQYPHIEILYHTFRTSTYRFDKGGAIRVAQQKALQDFGENIPVLITDSDIYLTDQSMSLVKQQALAVNTIYGASFRYLFKTYSEFLSAIKDSKKLVKVLKEHLIPHNLTLGCFQLYLQDSSKLYEPSYNCSECDFDFNRKFTNTVFLDTSVYHLGVNAYNWNGRSGFRDFIIDA